MLLSARSILFRLSDIQKTLTIEHMFTARKQSLLRLCFYRRLSVHRGGSASRVRSASRGVCIREGVEGQKPPQSDTTVYSQRAASTHPTEMHSYL